MLIDYVGKNPSHLNAHIYLYEFLGRYTGVVDDDRLQWKELIEIVKFCPDSRYAIKLAATNYYQSGLSLLERIDILADFLDYKQNQNSRKGWKLMIKLLNTINTELKHDGKINIPEISDYFRIRIQYWQGVHFNLKDLEKKRQQLRASHMDHREDSDYSSDSSVGSTNSLYYNSRAKRSKLRSTQKQTSVIGDDNLELRASPASDNLSMYRTYLYKWKTLKLVADFVVLPSFFDPFVCLFD